MSEVINKTNEKFPSVVIAEQELIIKTQKAEVSHGRY